MAKTDISYEQPRVITMNQIIVATHAQLAEGFDKAVRFFKSDADNITFINAYVQDNEFERHLRDELARWTGRNIIVLTDIPGGSVNQVAAKLLAEYGFHLVTGVNLPLVLEMVMAADDLDDARIDEIVQQAQGQIIYMNRMLEKGSDTD